MLGMQQNFEMYAWNFPLAPRQGLDSDRLEFLQEMEQMRDRREPKKKNNIFVNFYQGNGKFKMEMENRLPFLHLWRKYLYSRCNLDKQIRSYFL